MNFSSAVQTLADYRAHNIRASEDVVIKGTYILDHGGIQKLDDEVWPFCEQLAMAALDTGKLELADVCISELIKRFPESPRVDCLHGLRIEAGGRLEDALKFYNIILEADESNAAIWKRKISVLKTLGRLEECVTSLTTYVDTFYNDVEAWLELSHIYSSCNLYPQSLSSLSHVLLLSPQSPIYVLQFAETAYTAADVPLAIRMFLRAVEMAPDDTDSIYTLRAWYGIKSCTKRLLGGDKDATSSTSETAPPANPKLLDELATERLLAAYSGGKVDKSSRAVLLKWLEDQ